MLMTYSMSHVSYAMFCVSEFAVEKVPNALRLFFILSHAAHPLPLRCFSLVTRVCLCPPDPCNTGEHTVLDDYRRQVFYTTPEGEADLCDAYLQSGWYRFLVNGTDANLPTTCVEVEGLSCLKRCV